MFRKWMKIKKTEFNNSKTFTERDEAFILGEERKIRLNLFTTVLVYVYKNKVYFDTDLENYIREIHSNSDGFYEFCEMLMSKINEQVEYSDGYPS